MTKDKEAPICGVVMPISAIDGCDEGHWSDVLDILTEAIEGAGFFPNLVSNADEVGIIHKRIIQNLYDNPVVVCDVSGKNPNVMFELGMRLAFDKPTIIIKDDKTPYSFDTSAIEHLEYPRDLRFSKIVEFKQKLTDKITATHQRAEKDSGYTTFLKHFGEFTVAKIDKKEVTSQEFILEELRSMRRAFQRMEQSPAVANRFRHIDDRFGILLIRIEDIDADELMDVVDIVARFPGVHSVKVTKRGPEESVLRVSSEPDEKISLEDLRAAIGRPVRFARLGRSALPIGNDGRDA
ncbi:MULTISPECIES: hypothetical protein [Luteibacter]|uniref:hypothetical protein n=1 Tax=Luteibacter TaxID=242605 RepID=UPI0018CFCFC6|nr:MULTISPECIES: hypothetical protein [unclassified Luteibacter]